MSKSGSGASCISASGSLDLVDFHDVGRPDWYQSVGASQRPREQQLSPNSIVEILVTERAADRKNHMLAFPYLG